MIACTEDLRVRLGSVEALRGVELRFEAGEIVCLAGRSGAGKSTLLRTLCGLERPSFGSVLFEGGPPTSDEARQATAFLPNPPPLYPYLTVAEHVVLLQDLWAVDVDAADFLALHRLEPLADRTPEQLSLGQSQSVALALLSLPAPRFWLLDEPFNGLDATASDNLRERLLTVAGSSGTVVVATHLIDVLAPVATRLVWLEAGVVMLDRSVSGDLHRWVDHCMNGSRT